MKCFVLQMLRTNENAKELSCTCFGLPINQSGDSQKKLLISSQSIQGIKIGQEKGNKSTEHK